MRGGREAQGRGETCLHIADSPCSTAETNTTLQTIILQLKRTKTKTQWPEEPHLLSHAAGFLQVVLTSGLLYMPNHLHFPF